MVKTVKDSEILPKRYSIRDLLSLNYFKIPIFQRSYCWSLEHWQDFWDDLTVHMVKPHDFFLGSIVSKDLKKDATFEIVDGQQRITTCLILLSVIRDCLIKKSNHLGVEIQMYISNKEALRVAQSRLTLNKDDNGFFQKYIISSNSDINDLKSRGLSVGEKNILKAYQFFQKNVNSYSANLSQLLGDLLDNTYVIVIQVTDDMQAYTVFETLNARGQDLTAADLIKNSVLAKASKEDILNEVLESWNRVTQCLTNYSITLFIKYYLSMLLGKPIREKDLFKQIKTSGYIENDVVSFMSKIEKISEVYLNLLEPKVNYWEDKEIPKIIENINTLRLKTCYPLLLAIALSKYKTSTKKELLYEVESLGFRYSIIMNKNPNELEIKYATWAEKINNSQIEIQFIKEEVNKTKPSDKDFQHEFKVKSLTDNTIVAYILKKIGTRLQGNNFFEVGDLATVEHILPCKPDKWIKYIKDNNDLKINGERLKMQEFLEKITYRLGNQTLLLPEDNSNNKLGNELFDIKKAIYSKSGFILNQEIAKEKVWSLKEIVKYQEKMADLAIKIW